MQLRLWADDVEVEGNYIVAVSANIRHYLGGLSNLSPDAYLDDGLLDIWLFSGNNLGDALRHAYNIWRGLHMTSDMAQCITFERLRIEAESPYWIQTDGEPRGSAQQAEINSPFARVENAHAPARPEIIERRQWIGNGQMDFRSGRKIGEHGRTSTFQ